MRTGTGGRALSSVLAAAMAWVAVASWSGLVTSPGSYLRPALLGAVLIAGTGIAGRSLRLPWYAVLPAQLVVVTVWLHHRLLADDVLGGWLPTPRGLRSVAGVLRSGAEQVNTLAAPIDLSHPAVPVYLLVMAMVVVVSVDLIGCGLGYGAWTGLPLLITLAVPISVLDGPLDWYVLAGAAFLYAAVLAALDDERVRSWSQGADAAGPRAAYGWLRPAAAIGTVTVAGAMVVPLLVPLGTGIFDRDDRGDKGRSTTVELSNPMVGLRRDLISNDHVPLLDVITDVDPSYLRLTVLDTFTGSAWVPGARDSAQETAAAGLLPSVVDDDPGAEGVEHAWDLSTTVAFRTAWLPVPTGTHTISIDYGDWRYAPRTADISTADRKPLAAIRYRLSAGTTDIDPADLAAAGTAPDDIRVPMTALAETRPEIAAIARSVTESGRNDYEKAVLLQSWFRDTGGFRYSLEPAPGDGIDQLVRFITDDKVGFCQQFAAAMAVMARSLGIPARVVVGLLEPGTSTGDSYQFTSDDLHAWPEIYFRGTGWVRFEPTPSARTGTAPSWTRRATDPTAAPTASAAPTRAPQSRAPLPKPAPATTGSTSDGGGSEAPVIAVGVLAVLLVLLTPYAVRRGQRRRRLMPGTDDRADVSALWAEVRATATDLGIAWSTGASPRAESRALAARIDPDDTDREVWERLTDLVERARYQRDFVLADDARAEALAAVARWSDLLGASVSRTRAQAARWLPRSIVRSRTQ